MTPARAALLRLFTALYPREPAQAEPAAPERFALPHSFKPRLSVWDAVVFAVTAFLQILLGSLLFAVCGTYSVVLWQNLPYLLFRLLAVLGILLLFLVVLPTLLVAIGSMGRFLRRL